MFKMLNLDVDGTFVDKSKEIPEENIEAVKRMHNLGLQVALNTARTMDSAMYIATQCGSGIDYIIGTNGAYIYDIKESRYVFEKAISPEVPKTFAKIVAEHGMELFLATKEYELYDERYLARHRGRMGTPLRTSANLPEYIQEILEPLYLLRAYGTDTELDKFAEAVSDITELQQTKKQRTGATQDGLPIRYFDFMSKGITKASSMLWLAKKLGISQKEIIAFGDGENDIEMFQSVGLPIAMGNATQGPKSVAKYITSKNTQAGVADMLNIIADIMERRAEGKYYKGHFEEIFPRENKEIREM